MGSQFKDEILLEHILKAIHEIINFTNGVDDKRFYDDTLIQSGVICQFEIIGEATKSLSTEFTKQHTDIPWGDLAGLRDKLIHHYFGIELSILWDAVQNDLPKLKMQIEALYNQTKKSTSPN